MKHIILAGLLLLVMVPKAGADDKLLKSKSLYKLFHLSDSELGLRCLNGADPTGTKVGNLLIISCGH